MLTSVIFSRTFPCSFKNLQVPVEVVLLVKIRVVLGIDPGLTGGITLMGVDDDRVASFPMPPSQEDTADFLSALSERWDIVQVGMEKAQAMPTDGGVSAFNYGFHNGFIRGACHLLKLPVLLFTPQAWQKTITGLIPADRPKKPDMSTMSKEEKKLATKVHKAALAKRRQQIKKNSIALARQRYPALQDVIKLVKHDGLADSAHICRYTLTRYRE